MRHLTTATNRRRGDRQRADDQRTFRGGLILALIVLTLPACSEGASSSRVVGSYTIQTDSMVPTLNIGDNVDALVPNRLKRGDVIVFHTPPAANIKDIDVLVKRIVGLPGESIEGRDGKIFVGGRPLREPYLLRDLRSTIFDATTIPAGQYFVLGDNRQFSNDSVHFGPITRASIIGRVAT